MSAVVFRANASPTLGAGHVMRSFALAQECLRQGDDAVFVSRGLSADLKRRISDEGIPVEEIPVDSDDAACCASIAASRKARWISVDGYHFGDTYQEFLRARGFRVLAWDDYGHADHRAADLVLNQNLAASAALYARVGSGSLLLGSDYVALRTEFTAEPARARPLRDHADRVLVTLGGGDAVSLIGLILRALEKTDRPLAVRVLAGGENARSKVEAGLAGGSALNVTVFGAKSGVRDDMEWADIAITAGGSTCWEMAYLGVPSLIVTRAANQEGSAKALGSAGISVLLGSADAVSEDEVAAAVAALLEDAEGRSSMSDLGRKLIDGRGAWRIRRAMRKRDIALREATDGDARFLWELANDPVLRSSSFQSDAIPWEDHRTWFANTLAAEDRTILIGEDQGDALGYVRFRIEPEQATISIGVDASQRGRGVGSILLEGGVDWMSSRMATLKTFVGLVKPENKASRRLFVGCGFTETESLADDGSPILRFEHHVGA